jgi:hypothetical protein
MSILEEGTKVSITPLNSDGGATGEIVGLGPDVGPESCRMYIVKLIERTGEQWRNYKYSCVNLPRGMFKLLGE